jgi:hypothetical protein
MLKFREQSIKNELEEPPKPKKGPEKKEVYNK